MRAQSEREDEEDEEEEEEGAKMEDIRLLFFSEGGFVLSVSVSEENQWKTPAVTGSFCSPLSNLRDATL